MNKIIELEKGYEGCPVCGSKRVRTEDEGLTFIYVCTDSDEYYRNKDGSECYHNYGGKFK